MIDSINNHPELKAFIRKKCAEIKGGQRPSEIKLNRNIDPKLITVLKIDDYYISLRMQKTPKSIDCLIVFEIAKEYKIFLIELRESKNRVRLTRITKPARINDKFSTTIDDFMCIRFREIFKSEKFPIKHFSLFIVSSLFNSIADEYKKKGLKGLKCERYLNKPFIFRGIISTILEATPTDFEEIIQ